MLPSTWNREITAMPNDHRDAVLEAMELLTTRYLQGKARSVRLAVIALISGGHLLLEDIPGLGKTTLALAVAGALGLSFGRVQCTTDLLPSDITGLSVYDRDEKRFKFIPGPIFNNVLLVDEINRAMPKTQSALLEAMEEHRVTVEGKTYPLPEPFLVIATQNPVEQVGTFPLPESQLDRFMITTGVGYPPEEVEKVIIRSGGIRDKLKELQPLLSREQILETRRNVRQEVYLSEKIADYIYRIAAASRSHPMVQSGLSTRGGINLAEAARAVAFLEHRDYVIPEDVTAVAVAVGAHRLILAPESEGLEREEVFRSLLQEIPVPVA